MNSQTDKKVCQCSKKEAGDHTCANCNCGKKEWDLHPAMIRKIENEGSPQDVKTLHELEHPTRQSSDRK